MENKLKHLYIRLHVSEGEREHTHHCLHVTKANNVEFAAELYAARFWGVSFRDGYSWYAYGGEIAITLKKVQEISEKKYKELWQLFYQ